MNNSKKSIHSEFCPQVIQIGFAGARSFFNTAEHPEIDLREFESAVQVLLVAELQRIASHSAVNPEHFFCGISQIAIGGDMAFARACAELGFLHRIFLPQSSDVYLTATGSSGALDFSPEQQVVARELLAADVVVQEKVVSTSADRYERFEDANLAIVAEADILVCLLREETKARKGGTSDLMELARARGKPVLELYVGIEDGIPVLRRVPETPLEFLPPTTADESNGLIDLPAEARFDGQAFGRALKAGGNLDPEMQELLAQLKMYFNQLN